MNRIEKVSGRIGKKRERNISYHRFDLQILKYYLPKKQGER